MSEITITARKFLRLLDYLQRIGVDAEAIAARVNLVPSRLSRLDGDQPLPAQQYSRLFREAVRHMQAMNQPIPWAAGVGSEAFELMCHCVISARTLGEALGLAQRFDRLVYPMVGYNMRLLDDGREDVKLSYRINVEGETSPLVPGDWDRAGDYDTVSRASGLLVWHAFCGWLTGFSLEATEMRVAAPYLSQEYARGLAAVFRCPIHFDDRENTFSFPRETLDRRIVQTPRSLEEFLGNAVYHLIAMEQAPASTSAAIKSLISIELHSGMPSFVEVAGMLHMSESSLRRRLQREQTSYQALKDEVRCEVAVDQLLNQNAKVVDVAEYLGFAEPSSFVRSFKGWTGHTPRSYRENLQALGDAAAGATPG